MTTEKLYYHDQYIRTFSTKLLKQDKDEGGHNYVVLKKTAFYPTGGGQPHDIGTLQDVSVINVEEVKGEIRHIINQPLNVDDDDELVGIIDWERRFDHMQQHAGQHILSAIFENFYGYKTVSFHLGKEVCTIDLTTANLTEDEAVHVESKANEIILENRPIETKWVTEAELSNYSLRKELSVSENIRLVIIPNLDDNGCGGTHPDSTGQVGSLKILGWEKQKKNIRVSFVCGKRVLRQFHDKHRVIQNVTSILSVPQEKIETAVERMVQQTKDLEKAIDELKLELIEHDAIRYMKTAENIHSYKVITAIFTNRPIVELQQLARVIATKTNDNLVLFINENDNKLQLICARSVELNLNMNQVVKSILPLINGKGGGNELFAQGGGEKTISAQQLMDELINVIAN
ncbi:alanyl-tRNA editing protein [Anaerobacillus sp. MEB173]|uniref:alanyl-tRNA editing protein n=1 Tax=Anaerobacillus sp. MEB173 TaxID=3383345 RepID=UPI003F8DFB02